ncbi:MAG: response regulator transcription factor [Pseudomonadota bacterium]
MAGAIRSDTDIFVLGDNLARAEDLAGYLTANGCRANAFGDKQAMLSRMQDHTPDLVLLQAAAGSPATLIATLSGIRARALVPCIIHAQEPDHVAQRVHGLENGFDDWISATTARREVLARIRAVLRRSPPNPRSQVTSKPLPRPTPTRIPPRHWHLSSERRELFAPGGAACLLTSAEFDLLRALVRTPGIPVEREVLSKAVFRRPWNPEDRGIDNLVARLRRKLAAHSQNSSLIKPVRGVGYLFTHF